MIYPWDSQVQYIYGLSRKTSPGYRGLYQDRDFTILTKGI